MLNMDDPKIVKRCDRSDMLSLIESFPAQCREAEAIGLAFNLPGSFKSRYKNIVCTGLGGSAIGADIVRSYIAGEALTPVFVNRNYTLPAFVNEESLVITSSYSGNTEETLSAYKDAKLKKAKIIAITSGGELEKTAAKDGFPVMIIPGGLPPRCALGYASFTLLTLFSRIGIIGDKSKSIDKTVRGLEALRDKGIGQAVPLRKNKAKGIANKIYLKYPVIYGSSDHIDSVVTRWRGQIAENAKTLASSHIFPELTHNEIVGWQNPQRLLKNFAVIILKDRADNPRTLKRMDFAKKVIGELDTAVIEVESVGEDLLERIFSLIYTGDFVSFYLAILNEEDPTPVDRITRLKKELARS